MVSSFVKACQKLQDKPNNIKTKPSTTVIFKHIFKFITIKGQISAPLWAHMGYKG